MASRRPKAFNQETVAAFAKEVANVVVNSDVFPPPVGPWSFMPDPVEHVVIFVDNVPYCKCAVFRPRRSVVIGDSFGMIDDRAPGDYCIFADQRKVRTRFSPPRRLAIWRDAVRKAFPDFGEDDQGLLAAHLCRAHIEASYNAPHRWVRSGRVIIAIREDYTTSLFDLEFNDVALPHHLLWEEALDEITRFAARQANEFFTGFVPRFEAEEEFVDGMHALARRLTEEYSVGTSYADENPHLFDIATSFQGADMPDLVKASYPDEDESDVIVFSEDDDDDEDENFDPFLFSR